MGGNTGSTKSGKKCVRRIRKNPKLKINPHGPLGKLLAGWGSPPYNREILRLGLTKEDMVNLCCFVWWEDDNVEWPRDGSNDYFQCHNLYTYVKKKKCKSLDNELDYALIWVPDLWNTSERILLVKGEEKKDEQEEETPRDLLTLLPPPPYNPHLALQAAAPEEPAVPDLAGIGIQEPPLVPVTPHNVPLVYPDLNNMNTAIRTPEGEDRPWWADSSLSGVSLQISPYSNPRDAPQFRKNWGNTPGGRATVGKLNLGEEEVKQYPLREAPGGPDAQGAPQVMYIQEPLRASEIRAFRKEMVSFIEDPLGASEQLDLLLGPSVYTWDELNNILSILFSAEERGLIRKAAMAVWDRENPVGAPPAAGHLIGEQKFPLQRPDWDNNEEADRNHMRDLRKMIIKGMREAVPRTQNMIKAVNIEQGKEEAPATFLQRIKDGLRRYAGADPDDPLNTQLVKIQFVTKAWPDIAKKLQKRENWTAESMEILLREAQKIYVNREEEKTKKEAQRSSRIMVNTVQEVMKVERGRGRGFVPRGRGMWRGGASQRGRLMTRGRGQGRGQDMVRTCFHCGKTGHFKRECPDLTLGEQIHRLMEEDEYED